MALVLNLEVVRVNHTVAIKMAVKGLIFNLQSSKEKRKTSLEEYKEKMLIDQSEYSVYTGFNKYSTDLLCMK